MPVYRVLEDSSDFEEVVDLELRVWGVDPREAVPTSLLRVSAANGGVVIGAYEEKHLVGLTYALPMRRGTKWVLWSHMTGAHPDYQGRGIGFNLKQEQRKWALENGYGVIAWTFDPLQRGNANFNLRDLGATASVYHVNYYGDMRDGINAGLPSDRLEVVWNLRSRRVVILAQRESAYSQESSGPEDGFLLRSDEKGGPASEGPIDLTARQYFVEIPFQLAELKRLDHGAALEWRMALRVVLQEALARGYAVVDFVTSVNRCWYVLEMTKWYLYVVSCSDETLYTGVTTDLNRRLAQHNAGHGAAYTAARRPVQLVAAWCFAGQGLALRAEARFKQLSRSQKLKFVTARLPYRDACFVDIARR